MSSRYRRAIAIKRSLRWWGITSHINSLVRETWCSPSNPRFLKRFWRTCRTSDVPIDRPGELAIGIGARLGHFLQTQIHAHAHQRGNEFKLLDTHRGVFAGEMREVAQKSGPSIDFQQEIGQGQMRQQRVHSLFQAFHFFWYGLFQLGMMKVSLGV